MGCSRVSARTALGAVVALVVAMSAVAGPVAAVGLSAGVSPGFAFVDGNLDSRVGLSGSRLGDSVTVGLPTSPAGEGSRFAQGSWLGFADEQIRLNNVETEPSIVTWVYGPSQAGTTITASLSQVSVGAAHVCGLRSEGSVVCWESDDEGRAAPHSGPVTQNTPAEGSDPSCDPNTPPDPISESSSTPLRAWFSPCPERGIDALVPFIAPEGLISSDYTIIFLKVYANKLASAICTIKLAGATRWGTSGRDGFYSFDDENTASINCPPNGTLVGVIVPLWMLDPDVTITASVRAWTGTWTGSAWEEDEVYELNDVEVNRVVPPVSGGESAMAPDKVAKPVVTVGDGSLTVLWDAPEDGGSPVVDYDVRYVESGDIGCVECGPLAWVVWEPSVVSTSREVTITGLVNGTSYAVVVRAKNSVGVGEWSDDEWGTPVGSTSVPGVPGDLVAAADGDRRLRVSWSAPASTGGSGVDHYRVRFGRGPVWGHPVHGDRPRWLSRVYEVKGGVALSPRLLAGVPHVVTVTAVNAAGGRGPAAVATGMIAPMDAPGVLAAPRDLAVVAHGSRGLRVSWSPPATTGGSPIDHYLVTYSHGLLRDHPIHGDKHTWFTVHEVKGTTVTDHPKLLVGVSYLVTVTAVNRAGRYSPSAKATATTAQPELPAEEPLTLGQVVITNMEQLKGRFFWDDDDAVRIEWQVVDGATGYQVAYWFRQPYGEKHPRGTGKYDLPNDAITVTELIKRGELVCETDARRGQGLPCGGTIYDVAGGDTTESETPEVPDHKIPARLEVAVRAVNTDTDAMGEWSHSYSLPERKCGGNSTVDLSELSQAAAAVQITGLITGLRFGRLLTMVRGAVLATNVVTRMTQHCSSFTGAVADEIVANVPFLEDILDIWEKAECSMEQISTIVDLPSRENPRGTHPASEPYVLCGYLFDIDSRTDQNYDKYPFK